jgi:hypothetical protein
MIAASPVEPDLVGIDLNGAGNTSFPLFEAFSGFSQLLQLWLRQVADSGGRRFVQP